MSSLRPSARYARFASPVSVAALADGAVVAEEALQLGLVGGTHEVGRVVEDLTLDLGGEGVVVGYLPVHLEFRHPVHVLSRLLDPNLGDDPAGEFLDDLGGRVPEDLEADDAAAAHAAAVEGLDSGDELVLLSSSTLDFHPQHFEGEGGLPSGLRRRA